MIESKPTLDDLRAIRYRCQCAGACGSHQGVCGAIQGNTYRTETTWRSFSLKKVVVDDHQEWICCQRCLSAFREQARL